MNERRIKKVLVAIRCRGNVCWQLVAARKVGKHYVISADAYSEVLRRAGAGYGQTITLG
ncbi:hypothetical protein CBM2586_B10200 [Cupriavidus phytorum]|uniref:Uncharacterized protein n=1 Tax=Cupriavidus taiwanensis TaxID=164546 RepID=A0A975XEE6_9BURK|nr:hypothetical protein CBM2586_B10200 [Cupriavidus taiwanensis]